MQAVGHFTLNCFKMTSSSYDGGKEIGVPFSVAGCLGTERSRLVPWEGIPGRYDCMESSVISTKARVQIKI